jgi:hypothetical protein
MMLGQILLYLGSALPFFWGIAHLFPTKGVVAGFGGISLDNRRIITMEWLIEGVSMIFIGVLAASVTYLDRTSTTATAVYWLCFGVLNVLSIISLFTGFKISFLPFRLCPFIFTGSAILMLLGRYIPA